MQAVAAAADDARRRIELHTNALSAIEQKLEAASSAIAELEKARGICHIHADYSTHGGGVDDDVVFPSIENDGKWPLSKFRKALASWTEPHPPRGFAFLVEVGMMNPAHLGHVQVLQMCKKRLDDAGFGVIGMWLSPAVDEEVRRKAKKGQTFALSTDMRLALSRCLVAKDPLIDVGIWESQYHGQHWKSGGRVAMALQECLSDLPEAERLRGPQGSIQVFYAAGTDHVERCELWKGMEAGTWKGDYEEWIPADPQPGGLGVCVVPREHDRVEPEKPDHLVFVSERCPGSMPDFSSTKLREALENCDFSFLCQSISDEAAQFLSRPTREQRERLLVDFYRIDLRRQVLQVFQQFDHDGSGNIDRSEFQQVMLSGHADWSRNYIDSLFSEVDTNNDGQIQLGEFIAWCWGESTGRDEITRIKTTLSEDSQNEAMPVLSRVSSGEKADMLLYIQRLGSNTPDSNASSHMLHTRTRAATWDSSQMLQREQLQLAIDNMDAASGEGRGTGFGIQV